MTDLKHCIYGSDTNLQQIVVSSLSAGNSELVTGHTSGTAYYGVCVDSVVGNLLLQITVLSGRAVYYPISRFNYILANASPTSNSSDGNINLSATVQNSGTKSPSCYSTLLKSTNSTKFTE